MKGRIDNILSQMSLEEKAHYVTGKSFWKTKSIDRLDIPSITMIDGPHGLRKQVDKEDHLGLNEAQTAICFPTASAMACSFDTELLERMGKLLGEEAQVENVGVVLGPGNNVKRSPLCGRNFEYFSEDPYLAGKLAAAQIKGIQSKGVGASLKHFVANNQETLRYTINAKIDERTLREIYLTAFEIAVKEGNPWTVMSSYNRINGTYVTESTYFLKEILKEEWGFKGMVVSDWGASDELHKSIAGGLDLEMPSSGEIGPKSVIKAIKKGTLKKEALDEAIRRVLFTVSKVQSCRQNSETYDKAKHHEMAKVMARECMVLLKNDNQLLPLNKSDQFIAVLGAFAKNPRYQGGGSSHIQPFKVDCLYDSLKELAPKNQFVYGKGYDIHNEEPDKRLIEEAVNLAENAEVAIICVGLTEDYETEGMDREHLNMPNSHLALVEAVSKVNQNVVVVLSNGSPVNVPFSNHVSAILETWLTGEAGASAAAEILLGLYNPSGKLAETFIKDIKDDPTYGNFPGNGIEVEYMEGIYVGYRYHERFETEVLYPFGHGLSYTSFSYNQLTVDKSDLRENETLVVTVDVTNTGKVFGKEIVQLYVAEKKPIIDRPVKELKGFGKVWLMPGETKTIGFVLDKRSFSYYNVQQKDWCIHTGEFDILVGRSSRDICLKETINVYGSNEFKTPTIEFVYHNQTPLVKKGTITRNSNLYQIKDHPIGQILYKKVLEKAFETFDSASDGESGGSDFTKKAMETMILHNPFRSMVNMTAGKDLSERQLKILVFVLNCTTDDTVLGKIIKRFVK